MYGTSSKPADHPNPPGVQAAVLTAQQHSLLELSSEWWVGTDDSSAGYLPALVSQVTDVTAHLNAIGFTAQSPAGVPSRPCRLSIRNQRAVKVRPQLHPERSDVSVYSTLEGPLEWFPQPGATSPTPDF